MRCLIKVDFPEPEGPQKIKGRGPNGVVAGAMAIRRINTVRDKEESCCIARDRYLSEVNMNKSYFYKHFCFCIGRSCSATLRQ